MDPSAVEKAKRRLVKAEQCLAQIILPHPEGHAGFLPVWTDFLLALSGIYSVLEQGAKASPQSRQWFGGKKQFRRQDPLLQYLHQARNADEHGILPISRLEPPTIRFLSGDDSLMENIVIHDNGITIPETPAVKVPTQIEVMSPLIRLTRVFDTRYGDSYDPPDTHLGKPLEDSTPLTVATLGMVYMRELVLEAERIAQ